MMRTTDFDFREINTVGTALVMTHLPFFVAGLPALVNPLKDLQDVETKLS
jgi:hypothetical protein